jgi:hypothetical protein
MATNLAAGAYFCMLTDSMGCTLNAGPYFIHQPTTLEAQVVAAIPPQCNDGNDGLIDLSVNGGTPPYFYTWDHGPFSQDLSNLAAGTYRVTVADLHGCDTIIEITLDSPDSLMLSLDSIVQVRCPADSSGVIALTATGGTLPYRFDWSYSTSDSPTLTSVPPGVYSVTLSDASGCKATLHGLSIVSSNEPLVIEIDSIIHVNCHDDSTGSVIASVVAGAEPYWFNWSAGVVQTSRTGTDTLRQLSAGMYEVTVTDAHGCTGVSVSTNLTQSPRLQFVLDQLIHNTCFGNATGVIDILVSGGSPPYQFLWSTGDTTKDLRRLKAGMYQLLVTDRHGCEMRTPAFEIQQPDSVFIDFVTVNEDGNMRNGSAEASVTGGVPPFQFQWDTSAMSQITPLATNLRSGVYVVTITGDDGCEYIDSVFVDRTTSISTAHRGMLKVYPNPAGAFVYIEDAEYPSEAVLFDMRGQRCAMSIDQLSDDKIRLSLDHLSPGVYLLKIRENVHRIVVGVHR